jgi:hypothetical protein
VILNRALLGVVPIHAQKRTMLMNPMLDAFAINVMVFVKMHLSAGRNGAEITSKLQPLPRMEHSPPDATELLVITRNEEECS